MPDNNGNNTGGPPTGPNTPQGGGRFNNISANSISANVQHTKTLSVDRLDISTNEVKSADNKLLSDLYSKNVSTNESITKLSEAVSSLVNNIGSIGYWVRESSQNQGIASSAVELIKNFGFNTLGLTRLEIVILEDHKISRRVAEKSGAIFECIAKNRLVHNGQARAAAVYSFVPQ